MNLQHPLLAYYNQTSAMGATASVTVDVNSAAYKKGLQILTKFHEASRKFPIYKFKTVQELISFYGAAKGPIMVKGLGDTFRISEISDQRAFDIMVLMTNFTRGRVPAIYEYADAIRLGYKVGETLNIVEDAAIELWEKSKAGTIAVGQKSWELTKEAGSTLATPFRAVGETVSGTWSSLSLALKIVPFAALALGGFIIYQRFGGGRR